MNSEYILYCFPVTYFALLIARVQMLFTFLSVPFVASNTLASLSSPSTNAWMDTEVTLQKRHFSLWASTPDCLTTVSRISTEWKSSSLNRTVCGVIFNVRIGKDFGLKNSVFYRPAVENQKIKCNEPMGYTPISYIIGKRNDGTLRIMMP